MRFVALILLSACAGPGADTDTALDTDDTALDTDDTATSALSDEDLVRALIAGEGDLDEVVHTVAWRGGFPVATDGGKRLFVLETGQTGWAIAGDFDDWAPEALTAADGFAWIEIAIEAPEGQQYKFTRGDAWIADPRARSYTYDAYGEISYVAPPTGASRIDRWPDLEGQGLRARDVRVLVPPGDGPWPVLYAHDGQNLFDPGAFHGGWRLDEAVALQADPVLVVGIDNTPDRLDEYAHTTDVIGGTTYGGDAPAYAALLHEDLRPHVEAVYGSTGKDGVIGSSMGGLVSLYVAHAYPGAYDFAASLSGTLGWGRFDADHPVVQELYVDAGHRDTVLYIDSGGSDGGGGCTDPDGDGFPEDDPDDSDNFCTNRAFADRMALLGYTWDDDLFHWHEPGATHDEAAWAERVDRPLGIFAAMDMGR